jgi:hypothetical protein
LKHFYIKCCRNETFILYLYQISNEAYLLITNKMRNSTETIKVTANQSKRTFTIRKYIDGKFFSKYRTIEMNQEEFDTEEMNTENDWKIFLKSDDYYTV